MKKKNKNTKVAENSNPEVLEEYLLARDRDTREPRIPAKYNDFHIALNIESCEPSSVEEALKSENSKNWLSAMAEEMKSLKDNKTPNIVYAISCLSRYMSNAGPPHWKALKWLHRYLNSSANLGIMFSKCSKGADLTGYVDSNYANDRDSKRSTTSYIFTLCGSCIT
ncbi:hypothetical protein Sango_0260500 [Sesamum angolense]|uniref:Retrovirus-related Pol polyprotein from transposon TNT 1-94 n=1 Tax=Sesamum angolense TaxID=2727404 RepID=A0AAE2C7T8_9LAMI|nr:hypothetical protein Sango_0260500 [Sesamum angolense]